MKTLIKFPFFILLASIVFFASCNKDTSLSPSYTPMQNPSPNNLQLVSVGTLSIARESVCAATAGNKILFAGGGSSASGPYSRVDIYDITTQTWSTAELSMPRTGLVATTLGNKIYFTDGFVNASSRVDIYDASTNSWSTADLNTARSGLASGSAGTKAVFAGGYGPFGDKIDIYDASNNSWSTAVLNESRADISSASFGNKVFFSGGISENGIISNKADIFDAVSNGWSTITMTEPRYSHASIVADNKIFWAGGYSSFDSEGEVVSNKSVEIYDLNNGGRTLLQLSGCPFTAWTVNNKVLFFRAFLGTSFFVDVYDINTQMWSVSNVWVPAFTHIGSRTSVIRAGNKIFMVEGINISNQTKVWKLEF